MVAAGSHSLRRRKTESEAVAAPEPSAAPVLVMLTSANALSGYVSLGTASSCEEFRLH